ncbi:MAG: CHAD domain-containing protein [Planctomycetaceae bacterium]|nr:CHAD domain-containing protein [Planctomycetaceae bacterium]
MGNQRFDVWLKSVKPNDHIESVLRASLKSRIKAVRHFLTLASELSISETEPVHQLRVWTRRSAAAMRLYKPLLPHKKARALRQMLKRIRESAGPARDYDVLIDRYRNDADELNLNWMLKRLSEQRDKAQAEIIAVNAELKYGKHLKRQVNSMISDMPNHAGRKMRRIVFSEWGRNTLSELVQQFAQAMPLQTSDIDAFHQFRIQGKHLRYGIELLASAFPGRLKEHVYPELRKIQHRLGKINDHFVAVKLLEQLPLDEKDPEHLDQLKALISREKEAKELALDEFQQWWTKRRMQRILRPLQEILAGR